MIEDASKRGVLLLCALTLLAIGLVAIYASSSIPASEQMGDSLAFVKKQTFVGIFGFLCVFGLGHFPLRLFPKLPLILLATVTVMLILTLTPGISYSANGASRWFWLGPVTVQPAEFAKLAFIFFLAKNLSRDSFQFRSCGSWLATLGGFLAITIPLMLQPDFGSTVVIATTGFLMLFAAGLPRKGIAITMILGISTVVAAIVAAPYRMRRITSFLDPWANIDQGGYQVVQSLLGFQAGGLLGRGLGESRQKLYFLPEAHNDFILTVVGEELGFLGVLLVVLAFGALIWAGFQVARAQTDLFRRYLAIGLISLIALQATMNMGVTLGLLPPKGIPLPLVSAGSNSLFAFLIAVGILARLAQRDCCDSS